MQTYIQKNIPFTYRAALYPHLLSYPLSNKILPNITDFQVQIQLFVILLGFQMLTKKERITLMSKMPLHRIPQLFRKFPDVIIAESTRHGGVSQYPYQSLNLGGSTADDPENVTENNRRFFSSLNVSLSQVVKSHQIHGAEVLTVEQPGRYEGYDALITNIPNVQLAVTIADCTPILIYDPAKRAVAAIHAGWRGTVQNIVLKTVLALHYEFGTDPENCIAFIGTCIDECSFEVGEEVAANFSSNHKRWDPEKNKFFVDLKMANQSQLMDAGLSPGNIEISSYSTVLNNEDYFSYRHEKGLTGRMLATIGFKN